MQDFIDQPLPDLAAWVAAFEHTLIPGLAASADVLDALRADEDAADANRIGEAVAADPLLTLGVLVHAARHRPPRLLTDPQTVTAVAVLMGIAPFFRAFGGQPTVEQRLRDLPVAQAGLDAAVERSRRAARLAFGLALQRGDAQAALVHQAALLHDFAGLLLWCHAPRLAAALVDRLRRDPALPPADAERQVLNVDLAELRHALAECWRLPALLRRLPPAPRAPLPGAACVALAVRLAQQPAGTALPEALGEELCAFLCLPLDLVEQVVRDLDAG